MISKETIKQVIKESQEASLPRIFSREVELPLTPSKIVAVTGPRRSGKTYILYSLIEKLIAKGISPKKIIYVNFDDPRLLPANAQDLEAVLESFRELYPELGNEINFFFFDEIQNIENWEIGIRRIYDTKKFHIFLTGSSSKLLSKEISTHLRGRALNFEVLPFSFKEFLAVKGIKLDKNIIYSQQRFSIIKHLQSYFSWGGFPEVAIETNLDLKIRTLREYLETMFFKDLMERYHIKSQPLIRELVKYLTTNIANLFSINAFYKWIKQIYPVTKRTLINYVSYLEDIGLFFLVKRFSSSLKEQVLAPRKCYLVDTGFRRVFGFGFSEDKGRILENTVFLELKHQQIKNPLMGIFYYQDHEKREVDFVVTQGKDIRALIQVCTDVTNLRTRERETISLAKAGQQLKCSNLMVVTLDYEETEKKGNLNIVFLPLWKWLVT